MLANCMFANSFLRKMKSWKAMRKKTLREFKKVKEEDDSGKHTKAEE
jgi:hypothetical protein